MNCPGNVRETSGKNSCSVPGHFREMSGGQFHVFYICFIVCMLFLQFLFDNCFTIVFFPRAFQTMSFYRICEADPLSAKRISFYSVFTVFVFMCFYLCLFFKSALFSFRPFHVLFTHHHHPTHGKVESQAFTTGGTTFG